MPTLKISPFSGIAILLLEVKLLDAELGCFLVGLCKHVDDECESRYCEDQADDADAACEEAAELVDHQGDEVSEAALVADCEPSPLCVVHLALDCADSREAGSAEKVKDEEGVAGDAGERAGDVLVNRPVMEATVACQLPQPSGVKIQAIALPMVARMEESI